MSASTPMDVREVSWRTTSFWHCTGGPVERDIVLVTGIEPNLRWRSFTEEVLNYLQGIGVSTLVTLGALLADVPHTRPVPITGISSDPELAARHHLEPSRYTGPTGIVGRPSGDVAAPRPLHTLLLGSRPALRRPGAQPEGHAGAARPARGPARRHRRPARAARGGEGLGTRGRRDGQRRHRRRGLRQVPGGGARHGRPARRRPVTRSPASSSVTCAAGPTRPDARPRYRSETPSDSSTTAATRSPASGMRFAVAGIGRPGVDRG